MRAALCLIAILTLVACAAARPDGTRFSPTPRPDPASAPIVIDPVSGERAFALRVATWNVAGLPAPLKSGRAAALADIGDALAALRARGAAPHVLLIQEGFMDGAMQDLIARAGYAYSARGPRAGDDAPRRSAEMGAPWLLRGEGVGQLFGAGLYILSDFPIRDAQSAAFGDCAGLDCLANKGAVMARIDIPGAPAPVAVLNTHLNSRRSARTPEDRANLAHRLQIDRLEHFVSQAAPRGEILLFGGDFNMRASQERWTYAAPAGPFAFARAWCANEAACDASTLPATEAAMQETQDLQGFHDGAAMRARPVRLTLLDDKTGPDALSDHSAYQVEYRISWDAAPVLQMASADGWRAGGLFLSSAASPALTAELRPAGR